jgi:hypothetical protein
MEIDRECFERGQWIRTMLIMSYYASLRVRRKRSRSLTPEGEEGRTRTKRR